MELDIIPIHPDDVADDATRVVATRRTFGRWSPSRRTFGWRSKPSRRTFGRRGLPSRRTFGRYSPSRRTFGRWTPSQRTFGRRGMP